MRGGLFVCVFSYECVELLFEPAKTCSVPATGCAIFRSKIVKNCTKSRFYAILRMFLHKNCTFLFCPTFRERVGKLFEREVTSTPFRDGRQRKRGRIVFELSICGNCQAKQAFRHSSANPLIIKTIDKLGCVWNTLTIKLFRLRVDYAQLNRLGREEY